MASSYFMLQILKRKRIARNRREIEARNNEDLFKATAADQKCRICFNEGKIPIYGDKNTPDISENIKTFGDIDIKEDDDNPKYLCDACNSLLQSAILFRQLAKKSETLLHQKPIDLPAEDEHCSFDHHYEINVVETKSYNCKLCKSTFKTLEEYLTHKNIHCSSDHDYESHVVETKSYNCKLCKLSFKTSEEYLMHKNTKQHKNIRIQCPICLRLLTAQLYKRHLARHQSASHLVCEVCGKMYRKDNLVRHLQLHSFELPFQCQLCPYRGRFMASLKLHMRSHTGDKPFSCDKCQLRFLTRSNLNRHLLTHKKERPFKCVECGRGFYMKRDMDIHFKSDHTGIKEFECRLCGNKYGTRKALMRHELRVHKRDKMAKGRMPLYLQDEYRSLPVGPE